MQQLVNPGIAVVNAEIARLKTQHLAHAKYGVVYQLLRHDAQVAPHLRRVLPHVQPVHFDRAARSLRQPCQNVDERGLARPVRAEQAEKFTLADIKRHIIQRMQPCHVATRRVNLAEGLDGNGGDSGSDRHKKWILGCSTLCSSDALLAYLSTLDLPVVLLHL